MIDWTDSNEVVKFSVDSVKTASAYLISRKKHGEAKAALHKRLAECYNEGKIDKKHAIEKALLLLTIEDKEMAELYKTVIIEEDVYKGLEEVSKVRRTHIDLVRDLIRNRNKETE